MITGFEELTAELTDYEEKRLLPAIGRGMKGRIGEEMAITNTEMLSKLHQAGYKTSPPRIRKILHILRVSGMVPGIISTSKGYYVATKPEDYTRYIQSLDERIRHITKLRDALKNQYREAYPAKQTKLEI